MRGEIVVHGNGRLVLTVNPGSLQAQERSLLQKELEILAPTSKKSR